MEADQYAASVSPEINGQSEPESKPAARPRGRPKGSTRTVKAPPRGKTTIPKARVKAAVRKAKEARTAASDPSRFRLAAELIKRAADATRLHILFVLSDGEKSVGAICKAIGNTSQPAVSHHLAKLRDSGVITPRRMGKQNIYSLTEQGQRLVDAVRPLIQ